MNILFVCTANACRSIMAEAIARHRAIPGWRAYSVGVSPGGEVDPGSLAILRKHNVDIGGLYSKGYDQLPSVEPDLVVTVCDRAVREPCPFIQTGRARHLHWPIADPAAADDGERETAFESTYRDINGLIDKLQIEQKNFLAPE